MRRPLLSLRRRTFSTASVNPTLDEVTTVVDMHSKLIMAHKGVAAFGASQDCEGYHLKAYVTEDTTLPQQIHGIRLLREKTRRFVGLGAAVDTKLEEAQHAIDKYGPSIIEKPGVFAVGISGQHIPARIIVHGEKQALGFLPATLDGVEVEQRHGKRFVGVLLADDSFTGHPSSFCSKRDDGVEYVARGNLGCQVKKQANGERFVLSAGHLATPAVDIPYINHFDGEDAPTVRRLTEGEDAKLVARVERIAVTPVVDASLIRMEPGLELGREFLGTSEPRFKEPLELLAGGERHPVVVETFRTLVAYPPWTDPAAFSPTFLRNRLELPTLRVHNHYLVRKSDGSPLLKPGDGGGGVCVDEYGKVVGICVAADVDEQRVHYAVVAPIKPILDAWELTL